MFIPQIAKIGVGIGGSNAWKISYDASKAEVTVGFGTMMYNGKYFTTNDILKSTKSNGFEDNKFTLGLGGYVYATIENPFSIPQETSDTLKITVDIDSDTRDPNEINKNAPAIEHIPLAYIYEDTSGNTVVVDLRVAFEFNNFAFLAPGQ